MSNRLFKILGAVIALLIFTPIIYLVSAYVISLIKMEDIIKFSGPIFIASLSSPILLYSLAGSVWFFIFNKSPKFNKFIIRYLSIPMLVSFVVSFPISLYVDYKLKNNGYVVCDRISWMSPNTYVRDLSLCRKI